MNKKKTKAVIQYLLKDKPMEKRKLEMLLYFVSFDYFEKYEKHLTNLTFVK
jgi:hypothetical protein